MTFRSLRNWELQTQPFKFFAAPRTFTTELSTLLLEWLESKAPWKLVEASFYEQYEFSLTDVTLPPELGEAFAASHIAALKEFIAVAFEVHLDEKCDATVHKLVPGQRIRIHNDYIPGRETHRVLIQLNRGWTDHQGGALMFFNSPDPADVARVFRPVHNSCVAFEISPTSLHAVSTIHSGLRFTLVYSFYAER